MKALKNFIYFSDVLHFSPIDAVSGKRTGTIEDMYAVFDQTYPRISGLVLRIGKNEKRKIPWKYVRKIDEHKRAIVLDFFEGQPESACRELLKNEELLKKAFLDKQIVNLFGSKVVRVNDLHLLREDTNLWLVHIDVGIKGLLRRLGWLGFFSGVYEWVFSDEIHDKFISWKHAQPVPTTGATSLPCLQIPSARLSELHPADLAEILSDLGNDERITIFRTLDNSTAAKTLQEMPLNIRVQLVESVNPKRIVDIIGEMQRDEAVDLLDKLSHVKVLELFSLLPADTVEQLKELLAHSWHGAGSLMNTEFVAAQKNVTAGEAFQRIKTEFAKAESIYYLYVLDDDESLLGMVTLREVLLADPDAALSEFMHENVVRVNVEENVKNVARVFFKYNFSAVPVVDDRNHMLGIISMKDALEAVFPEMKEEAEG